MKDIRLICHSVKAKYFLFWGLTRISVNQKRFPGQGGARTERSAPDMHSTTPDASAGYAENGRTGWLGEANGEISTDRSLKSPMTRTTGSTERSRRRSRT